MFRIRPLGLVVIALTTQGAFAAEVEEIEITGRKLSDSSALGNTDRLLGEKGVDFYSAGGVSSLPALNGLVADRVKVLVDGAEITAACGNQMNPPLSYISANQIASASVVAGISPVSIAGDNIAGVISVNGIRPQYNDSPSLTWHSGYVSAETRSVSDATLIGLGARAASDRVSLAYSGAYEDADSYEDGAGNRVLDTLYRAQNHALTGAFRTDERQIAVKLTHQSIPFQGFPNQYMDMTSNRSNGVVIQYRQNVGEGQFRGQLNWHELAHEMGFFTDEKPGMMIMNTEADDVSYKLQWRRPLDDQHTLILGHEYHDAHLEDWWPAVEGSMMMGPNDYININDGERERIAGYAELRSELTETWSLLSGLRVEHVTTDAGEVQAYSEMGMMGMPNPDHQAAQAFNSRERERRDTNVDVTLLARHAWSDHQRLEFGVAQKTRSPNLYERYSWGRGVMATTMIGWFGDANGYVGDIDLEPEVAHTVSATYSAREPGGLWQLSVGPYYTKVDDYIDATVIDQFNRGETDASERHILAFSNIDATLYGIDLEAFLRLMQSMDYGELHLQGDLSWVEGERDTSNESLYQLKPLTLEVALTHQWGSWENALAVEWVDDKTEVDPRRLENRTEAHTLLNVSSRYQWERVTLSLAIDNLLDKDYEQPLGGVSIAARNAGQTEGFEPLKGPGRSVNLGVRFEF